MTIERIFTDRAPAPAGAYVQATVWGCLGFVAGQLPIRPDGVSLADQPFEAQARQAMQNLLAVVRAAGSTSSDLLKVNAFIVGVENWPIFNAVFEEMVGAPPPARTVAPAPELRHGALVEVDALFVRRPATATVPRADRD